MLLYVTSPVCGINKQTSTLTVTIRVILLPRLMPRLSFELSQKLCHIGKCPPLCLKTNTQREVTPEMNAGF